MESNKNFPLQTQDNNVPPVQAVEAPTSANENINYPNYPQNQIIQINVHNNNDINYQNNNNYYNDNKNTPETYNNKDKNTIQSTNQVIQKDEHDSSIEYDLKSKFLMKVYGIVFFQYIFIFILVLIFQLQTLKDFILEHEALFWAFLGITILILIILIIIFECCPKVLWEVPCNYIALFIFTFFLGFACAFIGSFYHFQGVVAAITCIIAICIGSFCIGLFNKGINAKIWYFILASIICIIIHYAIMALVFRSYYYIFLYESGYAILYAVIIAVDTITIKESGNLDGYIAGAIILDIDILRLFLMFLYMFGKKK